MMQAVYQQDFHEIIVKDWDGTNNVLNLEQAQELLTQLQTAIEGYQADTICRACHGRGWQSEITEDWDVKKWTCPTCNGVGNLKNETAQ